MCRGATENMDSLPTFERIDSLPQIQNPMVVIIRADVEFRVQAASAFLIFRFQVTPALFAVFSFPWPALPTIEKNPSVLTRPSFRKMNCQGICPSFYPLSSIVVFKMWIHDRCPLLPAILI
jgi:hypothetical protein